MVIDPRKRQKQVERKKAKDKARAIAHRMQDRKYAARTMAAIPTAPFLHCCYSDVLWEEGIGHVLISRELFDNQVAYAFFLLDVYCLGVKDATFNVVPRGRYDGDLFEPTRSSFTLRKLEPACARKLVEGGVAYAKALGIPPHQDYFEARQIFGDVDSSLCERTFEYGREGKPFFVAGPHDGPARCLRILQALREHCGEGGYHFIAPVGENAVGDIATSGDDDPPGLPES